MLGIDAAKRDELVTAMKDKDKGFVYVARQVDDDKADQLRALDLAGVTVYREDRRTLPGGNTGRSVIGLTDIDGKGIAGLEKQYDNVLGGKAGEETLEIAPGGRTVAGTERTTTPPVPGADIVLTIDRSVQYATEQALLQRVAELGAKGAQAIVMVPEDRRDRRHGVGAHQRQGRVRDHVGQLLGRRPPTSRDRSARSSRCPAR